MQFTEINTYDVIEENIVNGQLLCDADTDSDNKVTYSISSDNPEYFSVQDNRIHLTGDGMEAINKDNPDDISKEITFLTFELICTNDVTNNSISQYVTIKVARVIDNAPHVLEHFEHMLYTHNLYPNAHISKIVTVYNSFCTIQGINSSYFDIDNFPSTGLDNITIKLNSNGVSYFENLRFEDLDSGDVVVIDGRNVYKHKMELFLVDATNNKSTVFYIDIPVVDGDKYNNQATKNNAEIQAELLANKIVDIIEPDKDNINKFTFEIKKLKRKVKTVGTNLNLNTNQIQKLYNLIMEGIKERKELFKFSDDKIKVILESSFSLLDSIYESIADYFKKEINKDIENNAFILAQAEIGKNFEKSSHVSSKLYGQFLSKRYDMDIIDKFNTFHKAVDGTFQSLIGAIESNILLPSIRRDNELVSGINYSTGVSVDAYNVALKADKKVESIMPNFGYLNTRLNNLESMTIEDWGTSSGWKFVGVNLYHNGNVVIGNNNRTTVLYGGSIMAEIKVGTGSVTWTGSKLQLHPSSGDSTVQANIFTGTANKAKYADVAEYYKKEIKDNYLYESGTLIYLNTDETKEFEVTENSINNIYCGVVTTSPGYVLNAGMEDNEDYVNIALVGRVPVNFIGKITKGMYLYPDNIEPNKVFGSNIKLDRDLVGISLENKTQISNGTLKILAKVK